MNQSVTHVVILAAGQGTRMKSQLPKVLHPIAGRAMVEHVLDTAAAVAPATVTVVVGHGGASVRERLANRPGVAFAVQEPQLGTAHALQQTEPQLAGKTGTLILLSGDVPLLTGHTLERLLAAHTAANAAATVVTAVVERPYGYGRIVRVDGQIARIVEERDASPAERKLRVEALVVENPLEIRGINSRTELAEVGRLVRQNKNEELMAAGVTLVDPATTYVDPRAEIGADTVIHPGVVIEGTTRIGRACEIQAHVRIADAEIGDHVNINSFCVIVESRIADGAAIGPFAHLRPASDVGAGARIGNFVELKKTTLGARSKVNHLSYVGDATVGNDVNIGAGTITCNYDGEKKHQTVIEDGAFIGSASQLVAPVTIARGAYVASGTTVRGDVPPGALAVSAGRQRNIENWVGERKKRRETPPDAAGTNDPGTK